MGRPSRIEVLAEDAIHQRFVRRYLYRLRYVDHDIHFHDLPSGRGCGEQWVRERYAKAVGAHRARSARAETGLVVVIDADRGDRDRRVRQLSEALNQNALEPRRNDESIVHLIPKRSIETWVLCLNGKQVDEITDYSQWADISEQVKLAAETFFDWSRPNVEPPQHCVPSLRDAITEARRLMPNRA